MLAQAAGLIRPYRYLARAWSCGFCVAFTYVTLHRGLAAWILEYRRYLFGQRSKWNGDGLERSKEGPLDCCCSGGFCFIDLTWMGGCLKCSLLYRRCLAAGSAANTLHGKTVLVYSWERVCVFLTHERRGVQL